MPWPMAPEFTEAIQTPQVCFNDPELADGEVEVYSNGGFTGRPVVSSGSFACVYKVSNGDRQFAVRCFTREVKDQQDRYNQLDEYLKEVESEPFVGFEYLDRGIRVKGVWYPVVKMEWVTGSPLNKFVSVCLAEGDNIQRLAPRWRGINGTLRGLRIAHNDLQHGNVMVKDDGNFRLVDYDGIFLPQFQGEPSPELGHRNFQHPRRSVQDYDAHVDNFPSLVIYLSLRALISEPGLWDDFNDGENLILTKNDFADPKNSECFRRLKESADDGVAELSTRLEEFCCGPLEVVPDLESILQGEISAISSVSPRAPDSTQATGSDYRTLLQTGQIDAPAPPIVTAPPSQTYCPKCGQSNPFELIYCVHPGCFTILHPGRKTCGRCSKSLPVNAAYCQECGIKLVSPAKA